MQATIKEIAARLRSTEEMALQFVRLVQSRVGQSVSPAEILATMETISVKSLSLEKVVAKLQRQRESSSRRTGRRPTKRQLGQPTWVREKSTERANAASSPIAPSKRSETILERLEAVLLENWDRGEAEGLRPQRMPTEAFVRAVYQYTDRREGTRQRILQAATQLNETDVMLTPALVADAVHKLFES